MRGRVRSRERCPHCGARGFFLVQEQGRGRRGLVCRCGQYEAKRPEIDLRWDGRRYAIIHDQRGERFPSLGHAERALEVIRTQIDQHTFDPALWTSQKANRLLWENYLSDYLSSEASRLLPDQEGTYRRKVYLARHLAWFNGRNVRDLRTSHVEDYAALPCLRLALSPKTLHGLLTELRFILRRARRRDDIERLPQVPTVEVPEQPIRWLTQEQQALVLEQMPDHHRPIFEFMMTYGCRPSEARALCWDRIDRRQGTITLSRNFSGERLVERTKTKRPTVLPMVPWFEDYLESIPTGIGQAPVLANRNANPTTNPGRFYRHTVLHTVWTKAVAEAGFAPLPLKNGTRHSRGMQALNLEGWGIEAVRRLLGHTSAEHTKRYAQAETGLLRELLVRHDRGGNLEAMRNASKTTD